MSEMVEDDMNAENQGLAYQPAENEGGGKAVGIIIAIMAAVIVFAGAWYMLANYTNLNLPGKKATAGADLKNWQAVFLVNGQVYFGKIKDVKSDSLTLADIYYLQVVTKPLQTTQTGQAVSPTDQAQQQLTLIKLGNELHGPTDEMVINRQQILLTEKLKEDSRVVQAIADYLKKQQEQ